MPDPSGEYDQARHRLADVEASASALADAVSLVHTVRSATTTDAPADAPADTAGRIGPEHLVSALTVLRHLREQLAGWEPDLIAAARRHGVSWASLAPALGVTSRQAAERRFLRLRPSDGGEPTGEGRIQAERDKRAGDRAVAHWARENSAILRQLAGQISALENLAPPARRQVDLVQQALGDVDPATLLTPLADAHTHLRTTHANLADRIRSVTERTEQLRHDTVAHRTTRRSS